MAAEFGMNQLEEVDGNMGYPNSSKNSRDWNNM